MYYLLKREALELNIISCMLKDLSLDFYNANTSRLSLVVHKVLMLSCGAAASLTKHTDAHTQCAEQAGQLCRELGPAL